MDVRYAGKGVPAGTRNMSLPALQTRKRWLVETDFWCAKRKRWIPISFMASRSLTAAEIEAQQRKENEPWHQVE